MNIANSCMKNLSLHDMKYGNDYIYQILVCCTLKNLPSFNDEACEWQVEEPQRLHVQEKANLHVQLTIIMRHEFLYVKSNQVHCKRHEILFHVNSKAKAWDSLSLMTNAWHQSLLHVNESLLRLFLSCWNFFFQSLFHSSFVVAELISLSHIPPFPSFLQSLFFFFLWSNRTCATWTYWCLVVALITRSYFQSSVGRRRENDSSKV